MSMKRKKSSTVSVAKAYYALDAKMVNLRINKQFMQECNEIAKKWQANKAAKPESK